MIHLSGRGSNTLFYIFDAVCSISWNLRQRITRGHFEEKIRALLAIRPLSLHEIETIIAGEGLPPDRLWEYLGVMKKSGKIVELQRQTTTPGVGRHEIFYELVETSSSHPTTGAA